jgi:hypothetical protein
MFYSRRIGLNNGREVPLELGGRLTGRAGKYTIGVLNIQTGDEPQAATRSTNFSVIRVKRDVLRRSSVGVLLTNRSVATSGVGANRSYGLDGTFSFFENLQLNTYWARTDTEGLSPSAGSASARDDTSYRAQLDYPGDRYAVQVERLKIGDNFNPEMGYLRRTTWCATTRASSSARALASGHDPGCVYDSSIEYIENGAGRLESRERALSSRSNSRTRILQRHYTNSFNSCQCRPVGSVVRRRRLQFDTLPVGYNVASNARLGKPHGGFGTFYNGHKTTLSAARGDRLRTSCRWSPRIRSTTSRSTRAFTTHLWGRA